MYCPNPECPNLLEHGLHAEFRDGVAECSECGHALEYGEAPPDPAPMEAEPEGTVRVAVYDSAAAAHAAEGVLADAGIEARVSNEHFAAITSLPTTAVGGVELWVADAHADEALALIQGMSAPDAELPLDDEYESEEALYGSAETHGTSRPLQALALLLFLAAAFFVLYDRGAVDSPLRGSFYDRAAVSTFAVVNLPRRIDHLEKGQIELILELDLEYIDSLDLDRASELLALDLDDAVLFISLGTRDRNARVGTAEIRGVLELRNRYLRERANRS